MLSLEVELAGTGAPPAALAAERREVFSLFGELRAASYVAVALVTTGVGILIKKHAARIGPGALLGALLLAAAACYGFALRRRERTIVADYVLLLGALLVSAAVGYAASQFHLLGANWPRHLLLLAILPTATAYLTDSRLLLSAGLAALAGWFGAELRTFDYNANFGGSALARAPTVGAPRLLRRAGVGVRPRHALDRRPHRARTRRARRLARPSRRRRGHGRLRHRLRHHP